MAEVTVIAPNVVEFAGNLAQQSAPLAARAFAPPPPPKSDPPLKQREDVGEQNRRLAANQNNPTPASSRPKTTSPGGFNPVADPRRRAGQPSTQFLTQLIAQESTKSVRPEKPFQTALAAYERTQPQRLQPKTEPLIITRSVNLTI